METMRSWTETTTPNSDVEKCSIQRCTHVEYTGIGRVDDEKTTKMTSTGRFNADSVALVNVIVNNEI